MRQSSLLVASLIAIATVGCPGGGPTGPTTPPTLVSFTASSTSLPEGGGEVVLSWVQSDATTLEIDNGVGDVSNKSQVSVHVAASTTFTLTAQNQIGSVEASVSVVVKVPTAPPTIVGFTSNPPSLPIGGGAATLTWSVNDATSLVLSGVGDVTGKTSVNVNLAATTSYTLTASNSFGPSEATLTLVVAVPTAPPTISTFSASQTSLPMGGGAAELSWAVSEADSVSIDNGVGVVTGKSQIGVSLTQTTTYTLTATNIVGSSHATLTITVHVPTAPPAITSFVASTTSLPMGGGSTTLSWNVTDASLVNIDNNVGNVTGKSSVTVNLTQTTNFTLTASNSLGANTASVNVTVFVPTSPPTISTFGASSNSLPMGGGTVTLSWSVLQASALSIDNGVGVVTGRSQVNVNVTQTTTFTLTANNAAGNSTATTSVTVFVPTSVPSIISFTVSPSTLPAGGGNVTLSWGTTNAATVSISGVGVVTGSSNVVAVTGTTNFTLTAPTVVGSSTASTSVTVQPGVAPLISAFSASPSTVTAGNNTTLSWSVSGATSLSIDHSLGTVTGSSKLISIPSAGTWVFTLTATNQWGTSSAQTTVIANVAPPTINAFSATPTSFTVGNSTTLQWNVTGATNLSLDNGIGAVAGNSLVVTPPSTGTWTYTLTASNSSGTVTAHASVTANAPPPPPVINAFSASPTTLTAGGAATLSWNVTGATSLSINQGVGAVTGTTRSVTLSTAGTYTFILTASNSSGTVTAQASVIVNAPLPPPVINTFSASPTTINAGGTTTLSWNVSGATSLSLDHGFGSVSGNSLLISIPTAGTWTFTLTASNSSGSVTAQTSVVVNAAPPVINFFSASPTSITTNGDTTLSWDVSGATSLSIDHSLGTVTGTSLLITIPSSGTWTFTLTASNGSSSVSATTTVIVTDPVPPPVINTFSATPVTITAGGDTTLQWNVTGATSLSLDNGLGSVSGSSELITIPTAGTYTFTLTATNASGSVTAQTKVFVNAVSATPPTINAFSASPTSITAGGATTLSWNVTGATSLSIDNGVGSVTGTSLSETLSTAGTYTFTLTATNSGGSTTATAKVTVTGGSTTRPTIVNFKTSDTSINAGNDVTLSWSVTGASQISIDNGVGVVTGNQVTVFIPTQGTFIYTLTASSSGGASASRSVTIVAE